MAPTSNKSFETVGTIQGQADQWTVETQSSQVNIATFEDTTTAWDPFEDMEEGWRRPSIVHQEVDLKSVVTESDATNLTTLTALTNELIVKYNQHIGFAQNIKGTGDSVSAPDGADKQTLICDEEKFDSTDATYERNLTITRMTNATNNGVFTITDYVDENTVKYVNALGVVETYAFEWELEVLGPHLSPDVLNKVYLGIVAEDLDTLKAALHIIKLWYNLHIDYWPEVHGKWDNQNVVTLASPPSDLSEAMALANDIKAKFNTHLSLQGYGDTNTDAVFTLPDTVEYAVFVPDEDMEWENFERNWSIPDLYATPTEQAWLVTVDDAAVSWPTGHMDFRNVFEYIGSEVGIEESFNNSWFLPGSDVEMPNELFYGRYYDEANEEWSYSEVQLTSGIIEDFSSGWRDNDVGLDLYWDSHNEEWTLDLLDRPMAGFNPYTFATADLAAPGGASLSDPLVMPQYSGFFYVEVTEALDDSTDVGVGVSFNDNTGTPRFYVFWFDAGFGSVGTTTTSVSPTGDVATGRYPIYSTSDKGILDVIDISDGYNASVGAVAVKGWEQTYEDFSTEWVLSLDD
jgi:hypothetical protein